MLKSSTYVRRAKIDQAEDLARGLGIDVDDDKPDERKVRHNQNTTGA